MWAKLAWDVDVFRDIQIGYPHEQQPLAYAAINACIAATSLRNWAETAVRSKARGDGRTFDKQRFDSDVTSAVPGQAMYEAIANTAKHSRFADGEWPGGRVSMDWQDGDEDSPPGWILRYSADGAVVSGLSVNSFMSLPEVWWSHLRDLQLVEGGFHRRNGNRISCAGYSGVRRRPTDARHRSSSSSGAMPMPAASNGPPSHWAMYSATALNHCGR